MTLEAGYQCQCEVSEGVFVPLNGTNCINTDECATNNGGCQQDCADTEGSYICSCRAGFRLAADRHVCDDIDECEGVVDVCPGSSCMNTYGSYACIDDAVVVRADGIASGQVGGVAVLPASSALLSPGLIAGMVVLTAVLSVVVSLATLMGVRIVKRRRKNRRQMRQQEDQMSDSSSVNTTGFGRLFFRHA